MPTIQEILNDATKYPDNLTMKIGEADIPLGSLRSLSTDQQAQLATRLKATEAKENELNKRWEQVTEMGRKAQEAFERINALKPDEAAAAAAAAARSGEDILDDPLYAPVRKALEARDKKVDDLRGLVEKTNTALETMGKMVNQSAVIWGYERWQKQFEDFPEALRPKDKSLDDIIKYAADNKIVDRWGVASVKGALEKMTEQNRIDAATKEAFDRGKKEAEQAARAGSMPRPSLPTRPAGSGGPNAGEPLDDLDQLTDAALKDPELRTLLEGVNLVS